MFESRIAAGRLTVAAMPGLAPGIDALAACNLADHSFLRAAWYGAQGVAGARTLVVEGAGGVPIAAIPTVPFGPRLAGARKVPGSYWPLRAPLIAPACTLFELAEALAHPAARSLGPVWRIGPAPQHDPAIVMLIEAAQRAGWNVLARPAGTAWVIDCEAARKAGWPRPSTRKRLERIERRLAARGALHWQRVRGADWNAAVLERLGAIEAESWIAAETDGRGAKFLTKAKRAAWQRALADPVIAAMLCATILELDGRPVAFSFDCDDGAVRYGIAGSYASDLARHEIGKLANYRALADCIAAGQRWFDLGAGDSGYKREMGAVPGYDLVDLLVVRRRGLARLLAHAWGAALPARGPGGWMEGTGAHG